MIKPEGWIPYSERTYPQQVLSDAFAEQVGSFGRVCEGTVTEPDRVILAEMEMEATGGKLLPRPWQVTGSCVGVGGAMAYGQSAAGDVVVRGDVEDVILPFPYATYGVGREIAGMNGKGEGSFGAAQAKACQPGHFGILPFNDKRVPQPKAIGGWWQWARDHELTWSHPSAWPVSRRELQPDAEKFGLHTVTQARSIGDLTQALAQGYGVTTASMLGWRSSRVSGDVAIADWNDQWAHQMSIGAYWKHPQSGLLFWIQNQWGPSESIHSPCPTMKEFGVEGGAWITEATMDRVLKSRDAEVFVHSATGGFPTRTFNWGNMGWQYKN